MADIPIGQENEIGDKNPNPGRKFQTLADSALILDPVTESEKEMEQAKIEASKTKRSNVEEILNELKKLEQQQDNQMNIFSCENALLFFIEPEGKVKTTSEQFNLSIFRVHGHAAETIFLRVGTWVYPLFSELSPCFRSTEGIFIFPDIYSDKEGATVALLLPKEECEALDEILAELLGNEESGRIRRSAAGEAAVSVSENINRGSSYLSRNLVRASEGIANCIDTATSHVLKNMRPNAMAINPNIEKAAYVAQTVSGSAASATGFISSGLGHAVTALGRYISPYVANMVKDSVPYNAVEFTANTFRGIGNIYHGLEQSAEILTRSLSNNAVKIVEHRYGQPVGHVTGDVLSTIGNIYAARRNMGILRPKSIAKAAVKSTGQAILEERREFLRQQNQQSSS